MSETSSFSKIPVEFAEKHPELVLQNNFPRVWGIMETLWGTRQCDEYLNDVLFIEGGGSRQGFPLAAMNELMTLYELNRRDMAHKGLIDIEPWEYKPK